METRCPSRGRRVQSWTVSPCQQLCNTRSSGSKTWHDLTVYSDPHATDQLPTIESKIKELKCLRKNSESHFLKELLIRVEELAHWLRTPTIVQENPGSILNWELAPIENWNSVLSSHTAAHNRLSLQYSLLNVMVPGMHTACVCTHRQNIHI